MRVVNVSSAVLMVALPLASALAGVQATAQLAVATAAFAVSAFVLMLAER